MSCKPLIRPFCDDDRIARSLSYYVSGGVDAGAKRAPLPQHFDDAESLASGEIDVFTDPRLNRLDVVDIAQNTISDMQEELAKTTGVK